MQLEGQCGTASFQLLEGNSKKVKDELLDHHEVLSCSPIVVS